MKLLYTLAFALLAGGAFAQNQIPGAPVNGKPINITREHPKAQPSRGDLTPIVIDYDQAEYDLYNPGYVRYRWPMNTRFSAAQGDSFLWKYFVVGFNQLIDQPTGAEYYAGATNSLTVDSVQMLCGWENNSGLPDTLIFDLIKLNAVGYPQSQVLWSDTSITSTGATTANSADSIFVLTITPNFNTTEDRFGVRVRFYGSKLDTFSFVAGFADGGACNQATQSAMKSLYWPNSYVVWTNYESYGFLPTNTGGDIYYDCDQSGTYDETVDAENYIQNISLWAFVTLDYNTGVNDPASGVSSLNVFPVPTVDQTKVSFNLVNATDATIELVDVTGKVVLREFIGHLAAGQHTKTIGTNGLAAGVYTVVLHTNQGAARQPLVKH